MLKPPSSSDSAENNEVVSVIPAERSMNVFRTFKTTQTRVDVHKQSRVYLLLIICDYIRVRTTVGRKKTRLD